MKLAGFLLLAALLLGLIAHSRAPEYDEAYSVFLTAGDARPAWPSGIFTPGSVRAFYTGHASLGGISQGLKTGDVHPPLYFWGLELWLGLFGASWFTARLLSVIFSLGSLGLIAWLAEAAEIPALAALGITLLSYGFAYTGIVARDFSLAQFLNLLGFSLVFQGTRQNDRRLALSGGVALGAASFTNYLAVFTGCAVLFWLCLGRKRWRFLIPASLGMVVFLPLDFSYFLAQHGSRAAQFAAFSPVHAVALLAQDSGAALFGGLPLYAGRAGPELVAALLVLSGACGFFVIKRRHEYAGLLALAAAAPPLGLIALGLVFNNTPIEIRYLSFSIPYLALLLAAALPRWLLVPLLAVEFCGILGLALAPTTMQPQGLAARQIMALDMPDALILLPFGNDGVGVPGPFIATLPDDARIELLHPGALPDFSHEKQIILATIRADDASRASTAQALSYFEGQGCFKAGPKTKLTAVFLNRCADQQP
jgi:Dolichyl-phosphate-mannose-protein mannosyltransferase